MHLKVLLSGHLKDHLKVLTMEAILAPSSVGISELKANPTAVLEASGNKPVAILNRNKPRWIHAHCWCLGKIHSILEDAELRRVAEARLSDGKKSIKVKLDDL